MQCIDLLRTEPPQDYVSSIVFPFSALASSFTFKILIYWEFIWGHSVRLKFKLNFVKWLPGCLRTIY